MRGRTLSASRLIACRVYSAARLSTACSASSISRRSTGGGSRTAARSGTKAPAGLVSRPWRGRVSRFSAACLKRSYSCNTNGRASCRGREGQYVSIWVDAVTLKIQLIQQIQPLVLVQGTDLEDITDRGSTLLETI